MSVTMKKYEVFEILQQVEKAKSRKEKITILQSNNIMPLKDVLRGTFDESIQWNLPAGDNVPYEPSREESVPSTLRKQHMKFKYFVKGLRESESLTSVRRESIFLGMLEAIHPEDAKVVVSMINKKSPVKGLTKKLVEEAFPGLILK